MAGLFCFGIVVPTIIIRRSLKMTEYFIKSTKENNIMTCLQSSDDDEFQSRYFLSNQLYNQRDPGVMIIQVQYFREYTQSGLIRNDAKSHQYFLFLNFLSFTNDHFLIFSDFRGYFLKKNLIIPLFGNFSEIFQL